MKLTPSELKVLIYLVAHEGASVAGAASALGLKVPQLSRAIASLSAKGLVYSRRKGKSKSTRLADTKHATLFRNMLLQLSHMKLAQLLSGASLEVLSVVCFTQSRSRKEIAHKSGISEAWVARILTSSRQVGIVVKADSHYAISPRFKILADFVTEFRHYLNEKLARSFAKDAAILWQRNDEFIIETSKSPEDKDFHLTGPSAFGRFSIPLFMPTSYYYHSWSTKELKLEDLIVHSLLLPHSERVTIAALLVWKKNKKSTRTPYLFQKAGEYGVKELAEDMKRYIETEGRERTSELPPWEELMSRAEEYGIKP
jgi:predicted transcriptional regulator